MKDSVDIKPIRPPCTLSADEKLLQGLTLELLFLTDWI